MKTGYDPAIDDNVTVEQYHDHYGAKLDRFGSPRFRPSLICPACSHTLHTVGEAGPLVAANWAHDPSPGLWCPIKDTGGSKYRLLPPTEPDYAAAKALRASFFRNWQAHWSFAREFAQYADIMTLSGFIRHADKTELWANAHLDEWYLPYILPGDLRIPAAHRKSRGAPPGLVPLPVRLEASNNRGPLDSSPARPTIPEAALPQATNG